MSLQSLVETTNAIVGMKAPPSIEELRKACTTACQELRQLSVDAEFFKYVERVRGPNRVPPPDVQQIFSDLARFDAFLEVEAGTLADAHVHHAFVAQLLKDARRLRQQVGHPLLDANGIRQAIMRLGDSVCSVADELQTDAATAADVTHVHGKLKAFVSAAGGAIVVFANGAAEPVIGIYAHASIHLGMSMIEALFQA